MSDTPSLTLAPPERVGLLHGLTAQPSPVYRISRLPRGQRRAKQGGAGSTAPPRLVNLLGKEKPPLLLLRGPGEGL